MKKLILSCLGTACVLALSSCETDYDDEDDDGGPRRVSSSTTVTEETVRTSPYGTVQTQTTQMAY